MKKINSFFESPASEKLNKQILKEAQSVLKENKNTSRNNFWLIWATPFASLCMVFILLGTLSNQKSKQNIKVTVTLDQLDYMQSVLEEEEEHLELIENLPFAEDLELIEEMESSETGRTT